MQEKMPKNLGDPEFLKHGPSPFIGESRNRKLEFCHGALTGSALYGKVNED